MSEEVKAPSRLGSARVASAKKQENETVNRVQSARLTNENETGEKVEKIDPPPAENATSNEVEKNEQENLKLELNQLEGGDNPQKTNRSQLNSARSVRSTKNEVTENPEQNQNEGQLTNRSTKAEEQKSARNTERKEGNEEKQNNE